MSTKNCGRGGSTNCLGYLIDFGVNFPKILISAIAVSHALIHEIS